MATRHTEFPLPSGELDLARQLDSFHDPQLHLWFGLRYVPGVLDIDQVLWHEAAGVFVVEVKVVPLEMVLQFGYSTCLIKGRGKGKSPQCQAYDAQTSLVQFLRPRLGHLPYFVSTVAWPLISRVAWERKWEHEPDIGKGLGGAMLFREDLEEDSKVLVRRLQGIYRSPPIRKGRDRPFCHCSDLLKTFSAALDVTAKTSPAPSDGKRIRVLERAVTKRVRDQVPAEDGRRVLYMGYPGTGKTFRLLHIGFHHALSGRRVLFACFNKVLASDIRRVVSLNKKLRSPGREAVLDVYDVFNLAENYLEDRGESLPPTGASYDVWGEKVLGMMGREKDRLGFYDTVVVDEAQDMKEWQLRMVEMHATPEATLCLAAGRGQELYGAASQWFEDFRDSAVTKRLNRAFRNARKLFIFAQVCHTSGLDEGKIEAAHKKIMVRDSKAGPGGIRFLRPEGSLPELLLGL